jgi:hypothetical protein
VVDLAVDRYLRLLARIQSEPEANPELSLRELLLELLRAFGGDAGRRGLMVAPRPVLGTWGSRTSASTTTSTRHGRDLGHGLARPASGGSRLAGARPGLPLVPVSGAPGPARRSCAGAAPFDEVADRLHDEQRLVEVDVVAGVHRRHVHAV